MSLTSNLFDKSSGLILSHINLTLKEESVTLIPVAPLYYSMKEVNSTTADEPTIEDAAFGEVPERVLTESMISALDGGDN